MRKLISNSELALSDLPIDGDDAALAEFQLSFNGYGHHGSFEECARIANGQLHDTLTDLRTCLFFEQWRWRHFGYPPDEDATKYLWELVAAIREKLLNDEREC